MGPGHLFFSGIMRLMSWPDREHFFVPFAILCSLSPLISCIHSSVFSDWRCTVSSKFFDTQVPSISTKELLLPRHTCCILSRLCCNERSLLLSSHLSRIGGIESPSCSAYGHLPQDISNLILHCPARDSFCTARFLATLSLYDLWSKPWGSCLASGAPWSSAMPHPLEGVR